MHRNASTHSFLDWVSHRITESPALDDLLANEIVERLSHASAAPPQRVATLAFQAGHKKLAARLLDCDPEPSRRVQSLLEWNECRAALLEATESGNPDLVYAVTLKLRDKMAADEFVATIENFPLANTLYKKYCRRYDVEALYEIHEREGDHRAQAMVLIKQALDENVTSSSNAHMRGSLLASAADAYRRSRDHFHASLCEDQSLLANFQKQMSERSAHYAGRSIQETCAQVMIDRPNMAEEFRAVFSIPDRRFWRLKLSNMAATGRWAGLEGLSKGKGCPLGPEAFVDVCLEKGNAEEAEKYLARVSDRFKVKYHIRMGYFDKAAQVAVKRKDHRGLLLVRSMCRKDPIMAEKVNCFIIKMDEATCQLWRSYS